MAANNLVIWGDPQSNQLLVKIASQLPILWDAHGVHTPQADYPADKYALQIADDPTSKPARSFTRIIFCHPEVINFASRHPTRGKVGRPQGVD